MTSLGLESYFHFRLNNFLDECCATSVKRCSLEFDTGSSNEQFSCKKLNLNSQEETVTTLETFSYTIRTLATLPKDGLYELDMRVQNEK